MPRNRFSSRKVATAHDSVASNDVSDFDRQGYPGKRHIDVEGNDPVSMISKFTELGEALRKSQNFREVAEQISRIAEVAETTVTEEASDWFDSHTIKRNMKEMKKYAGDFSKISEELDTLHQRATALYDDMGNVLSRYFEIAGPKGDEEETDVVDQDNLDNFQGKRAEPFDGPGGTPTDDAGRIAWDQRDDYDDPDPDSEESPYEDELEDKFDEAVSSRWKRGDVERVAWGDPDRPGVAAGRIRGFFEKLMGKPDWFHGGPTYNARQVRKELERMGLDAIQAGKVIDAVRDAYDVAVRQMIRQNKLEPEYASKGKHAKDNVTGWLFNLSIPPKVEKQMNLMARSLLQKNLKKLDFLDEGKIFESTDIGAGDLATAIRTSRTPKAFARVANNMTPAEAREIIRKHGAKNVREAKVALFKEAALRVLGEDFFKK